jgi:hypothetical protein
LTADLLGKLAQRPSVGIDIHVAPDRLVRTEPVRAAFPRCIKLLEFLRTLQASAINQQSRGLRLGCEMVSLSGEGTRAVQRYIAETQKRRRLLAL